MQEQLTEGYKAQAETLMGTVPGADSLRQSALKEFEGIGFPTNRTEEWRYSDTKALRAEEFALAGTSASAEIAAPLGETAARFVFVNGRYAEDLSDLGDLWQAMPIRPLANHFMANPDRATELVRGNDGVSLLNTALMRDGLVLSVPAGIEIDEPIEIVHVMDGAEQAAAHTRHVIELGEGAEITIIEHFVGDASAYWTNSVLQARITEGAKLRHIRLQEEGEAATHTAKAYVNLDAESEYYCVNMSVGAKAARFEAHVRVLGEEADAHVDGVALAGTGQNHDMLTHVSHMVANATSDQIFRTVADTRGKTAFQGKVTVVKDAQLTEADQSFKALVFDKTAEANSKPELEILADDVKCSHGATIGQLDDKAIFYLTSRGIDPVTARKMLVEAFTADALVNIDNEALRETLVERIRIWMASRAENVGAGE